MQRRLPVLQLPLLLGVLSALSLAFTSFAEDAPTLSVSGPDAYLYAGQEESSNVITKLQPQETVVPLASIPGRSVSWYLVKTQKGISGWIKSSNIQGADEMERAFDETSVEPVNLPAPVIPEPLPIPSLEKAMTVPVEMNGSMIIVPVVVNRSLKTFMVMDTGASFTMISPRIAKKFGLRPVSRVSLTTAKGTINVPLTRIGSLKVGEAEVHGLMATVQSFPSDPHIEGLLGLNFLSRFYTSIDPDRRLLTLAPR